MMKTGYCRCDLPILEFAGNFFIEGVVEAGKILEKVICPALQALDIVMGYRHGGHPTTRQSHHGRHV
jgi:hypothetical protein